MIDCLHILSVSVKIVTRKHKSVSGSSTHPPTLPFGLVMSQGDLQSLLGYLKSLSFSFLSKTYLQGWSFGQEYVVPTFRSLLSSHPDITSLFLLLITFYVSLMILTTASRWMYSFIMGIFRMTVMLVLILGTVWVIKVGQGEDASPKVAGGVRWVMDKGKRYVWDAAGELFNG